MKTKAQIGLKLSDCKTIKDLRKTLNRIEKAGYNFVEFHVDMFPFILGGNLCYDWLNLVKKEFLLHKLNYSAHIGRALDLRSENIDLHYSLFKSSIDVASFLNASPLVVHFENKSDNNLKELQFKEYLKKGCFYAQKKNVLICLENIEIEIIEPVIKVISEINHDNLKMTFDTGHAYLASKYYNFDFLKTLETCLPYIAHVHLNDNFGIFEESRINNRVLYDSLEEGMRRELAMGDIHLPPFFAQVPFNEIFLLLKNYRGKYLCEYYTNSYIPFERSLCEKVRIAIESNWEKYES